MACRRRNQSPQAKVTTRDENHASLNGPDLKIKILHVGGTFGMIKDGSFFRVEPHILATRLTSDPQFNHAPATEAPYFSRNGRKVFFSVHEDQIKDSSNLNLTDCEALCKQIQEMYEHFDGFIVIHGTDTMSYSAAALSFMIENLGKPIIFTGSMIPMIEKGSDAPSNLKGALSAMLTDPPANVYVYFHKKLMQGVRTTKLSSTVVDAFMCQPQCPVPRNGAVKFYPKLSPDVSVLKLYPGLQMEKVTAMFKDYKGVVLESFGSGNVPTDLINALGNDFPDTLFINVSQCSNGCATVAYENGKDLMERGVVVCGKDMTTEAALMKLSFLIANFTPQTTRTMLGKNLRGDIAD